MTEKEQAKTMYNTFENDLPKPTWFLYRLQYFLFKVWYIKRSCYVVINDHIKWLQECKSEARVVYWQGVRQEIKLLTPYKGH